MYLLHSRIVTFIPCVDYCWRCCLVGFTLDSLGGLEREREEMLGQSSKLKVRFLSIRGGREPVALAKVCGSWSI